MYISFFYLKPLVANAIGVGRTTRDDFKHLIKMQVDAEQAPVSLEANELLNSELDAFIASMPTNLTVVSAIAAER